jgi:exo-1,4-beta-D-glucosaminidase
MPSALFHALAAAATAATLAAQPVRLAAGWNVQSAAKVTAGGEVISRPDFKPNGWLAATVPATVLAVEVQNGLYPDPFTGMNLRSLPGYPQDNDAANRPMPDGSPYAVSWWYRKRFVLPASAAGRHIALHFDGINYRANVWVNGVRIADSNEVAGAFRVYEFDVTRHVKPGAANCIAVEVFPQTQTDLGIHWVDWNPAPPDRNMGLWRDAYLTFSGPVTVRYPQVITKLAGLNLARLTVTADLRNHSNKAVTGTLAGTIGRIAFEKKVRLRAGESRTVVFGPREYPQLAIRNPRLWWPYQMGTPNLETLAVRFETAEGVSDAGSIRFGIREVTSELTAEGYRLFRVNGKRVLIKGAAWAPDLLLRPSPEREQAEIRYAKDMNLNAIRTEGKFAGEDFYDTLDREGLLLMPGWCCCDYWEHTQEWDAKTLAIAAASMRDQARRLRSHPSVFVWLNGSDKVPAPEVEKTYLRVLDEERWPNPVLSSATAAPSTVTGPSGVKMTGPYEYVPPVYWYEDTKRGGAYGYNTETSPGAAVPPFESLRKFIPPDHLWPIDDVWIFHTGRGSFHTLQPFTEALEARYGKAESAEDYAEKAQALAYETHRAMFEAYVRNKYQSTGVIQWMMDNSWPSMIWHLFDYYLRPGGSYYGAKKGCEPLHIQYSYDDRSVVVANSGLRAFRGLVASAKVLNLDLTPRFERQEKVDVAEDGVVRAFTIPEIAGLSSTYFVSLELRGPAGRIASRNFYWLSTKPDVLVKDPPPQPWHHTDVTQQADLTALASMPKTTVEASLRIEGETARAIVRNTGTGLAFFTHVALVRANGEEVLPILWEDNYFPLMPGERRELTARFRRADAGPGALHLAVSGWNVDPVTAPARGGKGL